MLEVASAYPDISFIQADINDLSFINESFDVVFSSMAIHYIEDFNEFVNSVWGLLNIDGYFIFSQEHPLTTAPIAGASWTKDDMGNVLHYNLTDYARSGKRITTWIVDGVEKYHRSFSDIINGLLLAGFEIVKILEPVPSEDSVDRDPRCLRHFHKPNCLLIKAKKV